MNNQPIVCICIPNYNNEKTISETLDSLINQTYKNIIIKIFDNASTDDSIRILREYEAKYPNIQVFQNSINIGGEANFSKCIEGLEGDFGAIYHADDVYDKIMVETQVKYLSSHDISAVFVRANLIDDNSNDIGEQFFPDELKNKTYHQFNFKQLFSLILKYDNFLITPSVMGNVDIYKNKIKSWNGEQFKTSADLDVWLRFSEIKDIGIITDKLISYRMSVASFSYRTKFSRITPRDMFLVIEYHLSKYDTFNLLDYEYLKIKDNIQVVNNKLINNIAVNAKEIEINFSIVKINFTNLRKVKILVYGLLLKTLLFLKLKRMVFSLVNQVNKR